MKRTERGGKREMEGTEGVGKGGERGRREGDMYEWKLRTVCV